MPLTFVHQKNQTKKLNICVLSYNYKAGIQLVTCCHLEIESGVAQNYEPPKKVPEAIKAPPTPQDVKRKMISERQSSSQSRKTTTSSVPEGQRPDYGVYSDSGDDDDLSLATKRILVRKAA